MAAVPKAPAAAAATSGGSTVPPPPSTASAASGMGRSAHAPPSDPDALLDSIESYIASARNASSVLPRKTKKGSSDDSKDGGDGEEGDSSSKQQQQFRFDPIDFLNQHYSTESSLVAHLPALRTAVAGRISALDESVSTSIQLQAERGSKTAADVARARASIVSLHDRIRQVQSKAATSERTVLDITRDMKRLDHAKRHLQQTITALKRLHMLIYAVDQLEKCASHRPVPRFREGAHLIDATRLLLRHFERYGSIPKIRAIRDGVVGRREDMEVFIFEAFRLGASNTNSRTGSIMNDGESVGSRSSHGGGPSASPTQAPAAAAAVGAALGGGGRGGPVVGAGSPIGAGKLPPGMTAEMMAQLTAAAQNATAEEAEEETEEETEEVAVSKIPTSPLDRTSLAEACLVVDALGPETRSRLIRQFCTDRLLTYERLFGPTVRGNPAAPPEKPAGLMKRIQSKDVSLSTTEEGGGGGDDGGDARGLDQVERRFAWFRRTIREIDESFEEVFPGHWKVQYELTVVFLAKTREHLLALLHGTHRDRDSENVTVLLKALQKSMLFEREMTALLQRDYATVFESSVGGGGGRGGGGSGREDAAAVATGDDGEALEFDEEGKGVAASSAEGIKIKYARQLKQRREGKKKTSVALHSHHSTESPDRSESFMDQKQVDDEPVKSILGTASGAFDDFMGPYIALERENMGDMLAKATADTTVDTRGELPVFTSSTNLFIYMKNSIQRCTVLTKGRTFLLLYKAFCDSLGKYAAALAKKFPTPTTVGGIGSIGLVAASGVGGGGSGPNVAYRIPPGEEVTICHVIDTCEYCAETVEGLQELIADRIDAEYKSQVDMMDEQEGFHDVTAKGLRILVSGLEKRTDSAFRDMSSINWGNTTVCGDESPYVRKMGEAVETFVETVSRLLPPSYYRNFCDKFALAFTNNYYDAVIRQKRVSEAGTQQMLLDVYNLKTLVLKLPVVMKNKKGGDSSRSAPDMYVKTVTKEFARIEMLLKLVGTPSDLLMGMFKANWPNGTASDLQTIMSLKGMKRNEQQIMLDKLGLERPATAQGSMTENIQLLSEKSSDVAARMNTNLTTMRQKVDEFQMSFR